jgi:4-hydroxybenzoate polyprenyltransferase
VARLIGLVRLVHPFPSVLDGLVAAGAAMVAGAEPSTALRLGVSMTALQASIGALNDLRDAAADAGRKPGKPIPAGLVRPRMAQVVVVVAAVVGLALAAPSGTGLLALAVVGLSIGYAYDLVAKGTAWSWVPFALGIPLLPLFGWYGAASTVPSWFVALVPMAAVAGSAVAVGNALADLDDDLGAGTTTVATVLGADRAWRTLATLWSATAAIAFGSLAISGVIGSAPGPTALVGLGLAITLVGTAMARRRDLGRPARAWEIQAIGAAIAAVAWLVAVA